VAPELAAGRLRMTFRPRPGQPIGFRFQICNYTDERLSYMAVGLVDYVQQAFALDGEHGYANTERPCTPAMSPGAMGSHTDYDRGA